MSTNRDTSTVEYDRPNEFRAACASTPDDFIVYNGPDTDDERVGNELPTVELEIHEGGVATTVVLNSGTAAALCARMEADMSKALVDLLDNATGSTLISDLVMESGGVNSAQARRAASRG